LRWIKILIWINNNFIIEEDLENETRIDLAFLNLRSNKPLVLKMEPSGPFTIQTDDMELAGNIIQSLATYLNIMDMQVNCDFPDELETLQSIISKVGVVQNFEINV
jgi:Bardet-Biedl syndrome 2 protein